MAEERYPDRDAQRISPALEGALVRLRGAEPVDLARLNEMVNDPDVLAGLSHVTFPQPLQGIRDWLEGSRNAERSIVFVTETLAGECIGVCSLEAIEARSRVATLGIWIGKPYWDKGYGTDAVRVLCRFGFRHANLQRIQLHVFAPNERGTRVYEKVGFKHEGTLRRSHFVGGRYVDTYVMGLLAEDLVEG